MTDRTTRAYKSERGSESLRKYAARSGRPEAEADEPSLGSETLRRLVDATRSLGEQTAFYGNALVSTVDAVRRYPGEVLRLIAVLGMGSGRWPSSAAPWSSSDF